MKWSTHPAKRILVIILWILLIQTYSAFADGYPDTHIVKGLQAGDLKPISEMTYSKEETGVLRKRFRRTDLCNLYIDGIDAREGDVYECEYNGVSLRFICILSLVCGNTGKRFGGVFRVIDKSYEVSRSNQNIPDATESQNTGFVVGRIYVKLDGFQGQHKNMIENVTVNIARVDDAERQTFYKTKTNRSGYFSLRNVPLDGYYRIKSVTNSNGVELPSIVPGPDAEGMLGVIYALFSSEREAIPPIIDCGNNIIIIKSGGNSAVERSYGNNRYILDPTQKESLEIVKGNYGFSGIEYFASSGSRDLQIIAKRALKDRQEFMRAEPIKKQADEICKTNKKAAADKYRKAIRIYSSYENAYIALASILKEQKKIKEALQLIESAQVNCPNSDKVIFELGKLYVENDQASKAILLLEAFLEKNDKNLSGYENLAKAYVNTDRKSDADLLWQKAITSIESENRYRKAADFYKDQGDLDKAIPLYEKYLAANPQDRWAYGYLADALLEAGRPQDGARLWERGLRELNDDAKFYGAGKFYEKANMPEKAIPYYEQYLKAKPTDKWRYAYLSDAYLAAGRYQDGDSLWQRGLRECDDDSKYYNAAQFYRKAGKHDKALPLFEAYARAKPDNDWSAAYVAQAHFLNGDPEKAEQMMSSNGKAAIFYRCAGTAADAKRYDLAEQWTRLALAKHGDGTIDKPKVDIERAASRYQWKHELEKQWVAYLKTIQEEDDYDNWEKKPYNWYVQEHPFGQK